MARASGGFSQHATSRQKETVVSLYVYEQGRLPRRPFLKCNGAVFFYSLHAEASTTSFKPATNGERAMYLQLLAGLAGVWGDDPDRFIPSLDFVGDPGGALWKVRPVFPEAAVDITHLRNNAV